MGVCCAKEKDQDNNQEQQIHGNNQNNIDKFKFLEGDKTKNRVKNNTQEIEMTRSKESTRQDSQCNGSFINQEIRSSKGTFIKLKVLGKGGFGKVYLVKFERSGNLYAMKTIIKENIEDGQQQYQIQERNLLTDIKHPFIVRLYQAFQSPEELYMILEFCQGGELVNYLNKYEYIGEDVARFYCAQIILILECLHKKDIVYRDLKPSNVLLHSDGYLRLADFGTCKELKEDKTYTYIGSRMYMAPDVSGPDGYDCVSDYYNLGLITYELLTGKQVYYQFPEHERTQRIKRGDDLIFPECSDEIKDFIKQCIQYYPEKRLGYTGIEEIKEHALFQGFDWEKLLEKEMDSPVNPAFESQTDVSNFNPSITRLDVSKVQEVLSMENYDRYSYAEHDLQL